MVWRGDEFHGMLPNPDPDPNPGHLVTYLERKTKRRTKAVMREPRLAGERNPSSAKISVANVISSSCTPA